MAFDGERFAADYTSQEFAAMSGIRARGLPADELRALHALKSALEAQLAPERRDPPSTNGNELRRCHLCRRAGGPLTFVPESNLLFCAGGSVSQAYCRHRARLRLGVPMPDSLRVLDGDLPPEYARDLARETKDDKDRDDKRMSPAVREALAALAQFRREQPEHARWIEQGHPRLDEAEHARRFGEPYQKGGR